MAASRSRSAASGRIRRATSVTRRQIWYGGLAASGSNQDDDALLVASTPSYCPGAAKGRIAIVRPAARGGISRPARRPNLNSATAAGAHARPPPLPALCVLRLRRGVQCVAPFFSFSAGAARALNNRMIADRRRSSKKAAGDWPGVRERLAPAPRHMRPCGCGRRRDARVRVGVPRPELRPWRGDSDGISSIGACVSVVRPA